jgi:DNA-directed RNA polymerase subunit RPC12/RpoP
MTGVLYTCAVCDEEFESERSNEEAKAESEAIWGEKPSDETHDVVCDDCFKRLMARISH